MIKKLTFLLAPLFLYAEIDATGFFLGADISKNMESIRYANSNGGTQSIPSNPYEVKNTEHTYSLKTGYKYYYTRVYFRYSAFELEDTKTQKYTIENKLYEVDVEYIPVLYLSQNRSWNIHAFFGAGVGYNYTRLKDGYNTFLLPPTLIEEDRVKQEQHFMEYGYQVGLMAESKWGVGVEVGYRYRNGDLLEFTDDKGDAGNKASFDLVSQEIYFGLSYLF